MISGPFSFFLKFISNPISNLQLRNKGGNPG